MAEQQMSLTLLGWLLVVSSIAVLVLVALRLRSRVDPEACKVRLEDIGSQLRRGELSEAEADAARLARLSRPRSSSSLFSQDLRRARRTLMAPAAAFLLVAGIGAAISHTAAPPETEGSGDTNSISVPASGSDDEMLASLSDYTRSIGAEEPASTPADGKLLPDVNTMIERLAARLETAPEDVNGWRMLGWSYLQMERYELAATAYAKALSLDPSSAELTRTYEDAKAKAANSANPKTASSSQTGTLGKGADGPGVEKIAEADASPLHEQEAQIRSMVDRLADRLESSPRDAEGWTRLMRSRVVLGDREAAATAFRKALETFKDDSAASGKITAAAIELGLKAE
jgi:cytochrome c-type biogenesis protein CcmH